MASEDARVPPHLIPCSPASTSTTLSQAGTSPSTPPFSQPQKPPSLSELMDLQIPFTTANSLFEQLDCFQGDFVMVTNVSAQAYDMLDKKRYTLSPPRRYRFRRYYAERKILIIVLPGPPHEMLHGHIYLEIRDQIVAMGLHNSWASTLTARYPRRRRHGDSGEGDSTGGPRTAQGKSSTWPTLVIEGGVSESLRQLRQDMDWWFRVSDHAVKIVIIAKLERRRNLILLEKYQETLSHPARPGATTTRASAMPTLSPELQQAITITRNAETPPTYDVARGALVLSFRLLFSRDPRPGERDVVLSIADLQKYAAYVWNEVEDEV